MDGDHCKHIANVCTTRLPPVLCWQQFRLHAHFNTLLTWSSFIGLLVTKPLDPVCIVLPGIQRSTRLVRHDIWSKTQTPPSRDTHIRIRKRVAFYSYLISFKGEKQSEESSLRTSQHECSMSVWLRNYTVLQTHSLYCPQMACSVTLTC